MSNVAAIEAYSKNKKKTLSQVQVGHQVIGAALSQLKTNLHILFSSDDRKARTKAFEHALLTIYFLQKGLDLSRGGDLEKTLFQLYEFCRLTVVKNDVDKCIGSVEIQSCQDFISEISGAWVATENIRLG